MFKKLIILLTSAVWAVQLLSQDASMLSIEKAIALTLENNYAIRIASNNISIAQNNTAPERLGYRPTVDAQVNTTSNLSNNITDFNNGESIKTGYAFAYGANASVAASYNIYDANRSINLLQLKEILVATNLEKKRTIEINLANVLSAYYEVARQIKNVQLQDNTTDLSTSRLNRIKVQYDYGQASRIDVLNAQVDIDRDSINLMNLKQMLTNSKRNLNMLMGRDINVNFTVDTEVEYNGTLSLDQLLSTAMSKNVDIILAQKNLDISNIDYQLIDATRKPTLSTDASYSFNYSKSAPGSFFSASRSDGLGLNLTLRYNIYDGGLRKVQEQAAQLNIEGQLIQKEELMKNIELNIANAWNNYQNALFILKAEESNMQTNQVNFERTQELYNAGQTGSIEYRQAQLNLLNASNSYINAQFDAKQIELQMMQLSGTLIDS